MNLETPEPPDPILDIRLGLTHDWKIWSRQAGIAAKISDRRGGNTGAPPGSSFMVTPDRFLVSEKGGYPVKILKTLEFYSG